jgi:uncharacterized repeat protein (TIGR01451 family)
MTAQRQFLRMETRIPALYFKEDEMKFRRILTPVVLIVTMLVQFVPGTVFAPQPAAAIASCDMAQFIADVTVPDGTTFSPGATFTKTWRIKNVSGCTWTTSYSMIFLSGDAMGAPAVVNFPGSVAPGATVDLSANMTAPTAAGHYRGYWKLRDDTSLVFGVGPAGHPEYNWTFFVDINVGSTFTTAFDFVTNYCSATWTSGAGTLPCPGTDGSASGFVIKQDAPQLETGAFDSNPGLLIAPQNVGGGFIQATYPAFTVQAGDRFQSIVNCAYGASSCYVNFQLRYQIGSGPIQTFWTFKERYDGLFFRANLDLSSLAGQSVKFILYMADVPGRGTPVGDRAVWSGARIVRGGGSPGPVATLPPSSACDRGVFISDVTIPDNTVLAASTPFVKTWRIRNNGTCTWTTTYAVVFVSGSAMGAPAVSNLPSTVAPGATIDISLTMTAPSVAGNYRGDWKLRNASGTIFGLGAGGTDTFYVKINVTGAYTTVYDFATHACDATWTSGAGALPCYGTDGDPQGFVLNQPVPQLEDGTTGTPGLLTFPQNVTDGYIQGVFPAFSVQSGDHFQSIVNCQFGASGCDVNFRLDYQIGGGSITNFKLGHEVYDGHFTRWDVDLTPLAGQNVNFILTVQANGTPIGDRAIWDPRIARLVLAPPPAPTATPGPGADLSVTITDGASAYTPGATTTYTVVVSNNGPLAVTGATFTDVQPTQVTSWIVSCVAQPGALCTAGPITIALGNITDAVNIPAGKHVTYTIQAFITGLATGVMSNTVTIAPPVGVPDPVPANNSATDSDAPPYADLTVSMTDGVSLYAVGGTTSYTVVVFNNGPEDTTGAVFLEHLPSQVTSWTINCVADPGDLCTAGPTTLGADFSDTVNIRAGTKLTYTVVATISGSATGALTNRADITVPVGITDPTSANNTASDTDLPPSADLMVTITDHSSTFVAGGTNTFTIVVSNNGPSDVVGGTLTVFKPTQVASWTIACTPDLGATCTLGPSAPLTTDLADVVGIPAGKKVTYTVVATINNPTTNPMTTAVFVSNPGPLPDPVPTNNTASDVDTLSS